LTETKKLECQDDDFFSSELESEANRVKFRELVKKGMCSFCGVYWKKYGHESWCKLTKGEDCHG